MNKVSTYHKTIFVKQTDIDEFGPRFPDMSNVYTPKLLKLAEKVAENHFEFKTGVYALSLIHI